MRVIPYDPELNSEELRHKLDMKVEGSERILAEFEIIGMWSFVDDTEALGMFAAFETEKKEDIYFSLITDSKLTKDHGVWLAKTLKSTLHLAKDHLGYKTTSMHTSKGDDVSDRFAIWLGYQYVHDDVNGRLYEKTL